MLLLVAALLSLAPSTPPQDSSVARYRAIIAEATAAVEGDSAPAVERRWQARAGRDPSALLGLATLHRLRYNYAAAERVYALLQAREPRPSLLHLYAELGAGMSRAARFDLGSARPILDSARAEADQLGDSRAGVEVRIVLATIVARTRGLDSARILLDEAAAMAPPADTLLVARTHCASAGVLRGQNLIRADSAVARGLRLAEAFGNRRLTGACLVAKGQVLEAHGYQDLTRDAFFRARDSLRLARDHYAAAGVSQWIAFSAVQYAANFWLGRTYAASAISEGRRTGNAAAEAWVRLNLAQLAARLGDFSTAVASRDTIRTLFTRIGDRIGLIGLVQVQGQIALQTGHPDEAIAAFRAQDSMSRALGFTNSGAGDALRMASALRLAGRLEESARSLATAEDLAQRLRFAGIAQDAKYERGLLAMARGEWNDAAGTFAAYLETIRKETWGIRLDANARMAEALAHAGRFDEAEAAIDAGVLPVLRRRGLPVYSNREGQLALLQSRRYDVDPELGIAATVGMFARAGKTVAALRIAEAWRGQYLLRQILGVRGARDDATAASVFLPDSEDIATLPARLPPSTALLMYVTGRSEPTTLFVVTKAGITATNVAPADSLRGTIGRFSAALEAGSPARPLAAKLARDVFGSSLDRLDPSVTQLLIVPDGVLYRVPFEALVLNGGATMVERFAVALAPSTRIAAHWWTAPPPQVRRAVIFGDPVFRTEAKLARLPSSGGEARTVAGFHSGPSLLLRAEASERTLKTGLDGAGILHLATHAVVSDLGILNSGLELAPGAGEDGRVDVNEIAGLSLQDALVVLSGCRTVGGAVVSGEGLQGLITPFLEAGARTIVATQWAVGDRTMTQLMGDFYRALAQGVPVGEALRRAKVAALKRGAPASVWASLALVGDPLLKPVLR